MQYMNSNLRPASKEAREEGCTCPEPDLTFFEWKYTYSSDCPVHNLEK